MRPIMLFSALLLALFGFSGSARAQAEEQALVDRATLTLQEMMGPADNTGDARALLRNAKAVLICPRIFRAGFIVGGEFGDCVLSARDGRRFLAMLDAAGTPNAALRAAAARYATPRDATPLDATPRDATPGDAGARRTSKGRSRRER